MSSWELWSSPPASARLDAWLVSVGDRVLPGTPLCKLHSGRSVRATRAGKVVELSGALSAGGELAPGDRLVLLGPCEHPVVMKDMCADCGADLREKDGRPGERALLAVASVPMIHHIPELHVSEEEARVVGSADSAALVAARRLELLVDLDQTLIHTTNEPATCSDLADVFSFRLGPGSPMYHTKLRPGAQDFLRSIADAFQLHIATFGARLYAHKIAEFLDPTGKLFGQRILSRDESFDPNLKSLNLKYLFPCGDHMVCIIDDREDVWGNAANVITVEPYRFFKGTGDINAPPNAASTSNEKGDGDDESPGDGKEKGDDGPEVSEDTDDYLIQLEKILRRIHSAYYDLYEEGKPLPNLKAVMPYVKKKVLSGVRVVFSSMFPREATASESWAWQLAVDMGADVADELELEDPALQTTHVVAAKWGTSKVMAADRFNRELPEGAALQPVHIVTADWLWRCNHYWAKADEGGYSLRKGATVRPPPLVRPVQRALGRGGRGALDGGMESGSLAKAQLASMADEVAEALGDSDGEEDGEDGEESEAESLSADAPRGWKRKADQADEDGETPKRRRIEKGSPSWPADRKRPFPRRQDSGNSENSNKTRGTAERRRKPSIFAELRRLRRELAEMKKGPKPSLAEPAEPAGLGMPGLAAARRQAAAAQ